MGGLYLAIGDSITWNNYESGAISSDIYPWKLRDAIEVNYGQIDFINKGLGGNTSTESASESNLSWQCNIQPDLVTIGLGMNDCANQSVSVATYKTNLETIIDTIRNHKSDTVIILCTPSTTNDATRTPYIAEYRTGMVEVATSKNVSICHFENAWAIGDVATYCTDGIHPNKAGHTLLHNLLYPVVQSAVGIWLNSL